MNLEGTPAWEFSVRVTISHYKNVFRNITQLHYCPIEISLWIPTTPPQQLEKVPPFIFMQRVFCLQICIALLDGVT